MYLVGCFIRSLHDARSLEHKANHVFCETSILGKIVDTATMCLSLVYFPICIYIYIYIYISRFSV